VCRSGSGTPRYCFNGFTGEDSGQYFLGTSGLESCILCELGANVPSCHEIATGLLLATAPAMAQSGAPLVLDWAAPVGCPTASEVQSEVERLVGTALPSGRRLWVRATLVEDAARRWTLTLRTRVDNESGERVLSGNSCRAVADAVVLTLALTLNPELKLSESDASSVETPNPPSASPTPHEPIVNASPADAHASLHGYARMLLGVHAGAADLAGEAGLGVGIGYGHLQNWFLATLSPEADVTSAIKSNAGARYWQGSLVALACYSLGGQSFAIEPCLGLEGSRLQGSGNGFDQTTHASIAWFSAVAGAGLTWKFHRNWHARVDGYGLLPLKHPYAYVTSSQTDVILQPAPVGAQANLGLQYQFW
jgi:hypothetical protein